LLPHDLNGFCGKVLYCIHGSTKEEIAPSVLHVEGENISKGT